MSTQRKFQRLPLKWIEPFIERVLIDIVKDWLINISKEGEAIFH
jgi:hypothetical protein